MNVTASLAAGVKLPKMCKVHQQFANTGLEENEIISRIHKEFARDAIQKRIHPGMRIAVTCGSRGVANIALVLRTITGLLQKAEAVPFIVPAMGSHGGATAEGQREILAGYGVTEETMGCPVVSSMEVKQIGWTDDRKPVYIDQNAAEADGIVVVGRIKPHTGFRGPYESGLMKMMVIGLGKQRGAEICHLSGFGKMADNIEHIGKIILRNAPILCGVGLVENSLEQTWKIAALTPDEIIEKEPGLLLEAKQQMPRLPFPQIDVLIVDRIGKDISGDGMDPNITGTFCSPYAEGGIKAERVVILDLTEASHGCAVGMGMADFTTRRFFEKIDFDATYPNAITSKMTVQAKIPVVLDNDLDAIRIALKTCCFADINNPRIIRIKDTLHLEDFLISDALVAQAQTISAIQSIGAPAALAFDQSGGLLPDANLSNVDA